MGVSDSPRSVAGIPFGPEGSPFILESCPVCLRCPVLVVGEKGTPAGKLEYGCLICGYLIDGRQLAALLAMHELVSQETSGRGKST